MAKIKMFETFMRLAIPTELKADLQRLAEDRNVSLSAFVRLILSEYIRKNKFL